MEDDYQTDEKLANWLKIEQWFLRILGVVLLLAAVLGLILGILYNPDNESSVSVVNIIIAVALAIAGLWTLYTSTKNESLEKAIDGYIEQGSTISYMLTGVQVIVGLLFLLEGTSRGLIVMILLALTMLASAGFFIWRGRQIGKYQE